jgi:Mg-chelatase subunit ChlD
LRAIVYDTSGSMRDAVQTADGSRAAKYLIANRALAQIVTRIEQFATNTATPRAVHGGLYIFRGTDVHEAVPMGPFDAGKFRDWLKSYRGPNSGTPLGTAVDAASRAVLSSKLPPKHVLVITDGRNTQGRIPRYSLVQQGAERRVGVHAFRRVRHRSQTFAHKRWA